MKIQSTRGTNPLRESSFLNVPRAEKARSAAPARAAKVQVSNLATKIAEARAPEVIDQSRIARIKEAIADGTFPIDPTRIAKRMLSEESG